MQGILGSCLELLLVGGCNSVQNILGWQIVSTRDTHIPNAALCKRELQHESSLSPSLSLSLLTLHSCAEFLFELIARNGNNALRYAIAFSQGLIAAVRDGVHLQCGHITIPTYRKESD